MEYGNAHADKRRRTETVDEYEPHAVVHHHGYDGQQHQQQQQMQMQQQQQQMQQQQQQMQQQQQLQQQQFQQPQQQQYRQPQQPQQQQPQQQQPSLQQQGADLPPGAMEQFMLTPEFAHFRQHMIDGFAAQNQPPPNAETIAEQYRVWKLQQLAQFRQRQMMAQQQQQQLMMAQQQQLMQQQLIQQQQPPPQQQQQLQQLMQQQQQQAQQQQGKRNAADSGMGGLMGAGDGEFKISFRVPTDAVGTIMGSRGSRVKEVQDKSGARVFIEREEEPGTNERTVYMSGSQEACERAKKLVTDRIDEWTAEGGSSRVGPGGLLTQAQPGHETETVQIPTAAAGFIIGSAGSAIQQLQGESGARISVHTGPDELVDGQLMRAVTISGRRECVDLAKDLLAGRVALFSERVENGGDWNTGEEYTATHVINNIGNFVDGGAQQLAVDVEQAQEGDGPALTVPVEAREALGYIIGRGGCGINAIETEFGVRIRVVREGNPPYLLVAGADGNVASGRDALVARHEEWKEELYVPMPRNSLGFIIGKGG
ncbi:hypothetical protein T492DRAFT_898638, partial [Pavlovales sp. CCMP2436]